MIPKPALLFVSRFFNALMEPADISTIHIVLQKHFSSSMEMRQKIFRARLLLEKHLCVRSTHAVSVENLRTRITCRCSLLCVDVVLQPTIENVCLGTVSFSHKSSIIHMFFVDCSF